VIVDKPGAITLDQVEAIERTARHTGSHFFDLFFRTLHGARLRAGGTFGRKG
jgi:predicted dehydrogenase